MTPKSLLRQSFVASPPEALAEGGWQPILDDPQPENRSARRVIFCTGKVAVDLMTADLRKETTDVAIIRLEQLYPLPEIKPVIEQYSDAEEIVWLQEEPKNMGVWGYLHPHLVSMLQDQKPLYYMGRPQSSSPAEGSSTWHSATQKRLIKEAFNLANKEPEENGIIWERA
jgi:2-oxoglutarate dehydrogenase E1 component